VILAPSARAALLTVAGVNVLWSASYTAGKTALDETSFSSLNCLRFTLATLVCVPLLIRHRRELPRNRGDLLRLGAIAGLGFSANKALEYGGLSLTTATDTALLITTESLATLVLAVVVLRERLQRRTGLGLILGCFGVYVLVEGGLVLPHVPTGDQAIGDLLVVASLVMEAGATIAGRSLMSRKSSPFTLTAAAVALSLVVWLPAGASGAIHDAGRLHLAAWAGVAYLAIIGTVLTYGAWFWALRHLEAQAVTPLLLIQPLAGSLIAIVLRGERPSPATVLGGAIILIGVLLVVIRPTRVTAELDEHAFTA
jgi:drug/metabolite transporter (DMT)-like permease